MAEHEDGIEDAPGNATGATIAGGESGGGAYPNPHTGQKPEGGGFLGHGGQTEITYSGGEDGGEENAATGAD